MRVLSRHDGTSDGDTACAGESSAIAYYAFTAEAHGEDMGSFVLCMSAK